MFKVIRNTLFTIAVVALTAVGLQWHNRLIKSQSALRLSTTVLASQSFVSASPGLPVKISFNSPQVRLGQAEAVTISSVPNAKLEVVTQYPDGSTNHPDTFQGSTDGSGHRSFTVNVNDFHNLGLVRVSVVATAGTKTAQAIGQFQVAPWEIPAAGQGTGYTYPLLP